MYKKVCCTCKVFFFLLIRKKKCAARANFFFLIRSICVVFYRSRCFQLFLSITYFSLWNLQILKGASLLALPNSIYHLILYIKGTARETVSDFRFPEVCIFLNFINPLSPNGVQHQFPPSNIHTLSRDKVVKINKMITLEKMP